MIFIFKTLAKNRTPTNSNSWKRRASQIQTLTFGLAINLSEILIYMIRLDAYF